MNNEFEQGVRLIREAYTRKLTSYEQQIKQLQEDKDMLLDRNQKLEASHHELQLQLHQAQERINKLSHFKQTIMDSFSMATSDEPATSFRKSNIEYEHSPLLSQSNYTKGQHSELFSTSNGVKEDSIDARAYFKSLKRVVTYDEYSQIYALVKQYNDRLQSQSEVLFKVQKILLPKYPILFEEFKQLIN